MYSIPRRYCILHKYLYFKTLPRSILLQQRELFSVLQTQLLIQFQFKVLLDIKKTCDK